MPWIMFILFIAQIQISFKQYVQFCFLRVLGSNIYIGFMHKFTVSILSQRQNNFHSKVYTYITEKQLELFIAVEIHTYSDDLKAS